MLEKIHINSYEVDFHKARVRSNFRNKVTLAITYLCTKIARMYLHATFSTSHRFGGRQVSAYDRSKNRQRTGKYNMTVQPTLINGKPTLNGVDVTYVGRSFTPEEMTALGSSEQRLVFTERDHLGITISRGSRGRGWGNYRGRGCGCGRGVED